MLIPEAEPFYYPGGPQGCLLIHGFTGSPKEMHGLGTYLSQQGMTVLGVRLAGHATCIEDMARTHWQDWLACVEDGYYFLKNAVDQIFLIGLSLGGILSLTFASGRFTPGCPVDGVLAMSAPHHLPIDKQLVPFLKIASKVKFSQPKKPGDWFDKDAETQNFCYPADPIRGAVELQSLIQQMIIGLPLLTAPVRLIYSKDDQTVRYNEHHAQLIFDQVGSQEKDLVWIDGSGHNITADAQRQQVYEITAEFVRAHTRQLG